MPAPDTSPASSNPAEHLPMLTANERWHRVLDAGSRDSLARLLPDWLQKRRWFSGKAKTMHGVEIVDAVPLGGDSELDTLYMLIVRVKYVHDSAETYVLPVGFATGTLATALSGDNSTSLLASLQVSTGGNTVSGVLYDVLSEAAFGRLMLDMISGGRPLHGRLGMLSGHPLKSFDSLRGSPDEQLVIRTMKVEQSNSSVIYGDRLMLKLFRRIEVGLNPDLEIGRFLTETAHFPHAPLVAGFVDYQDRSGQSSTVGIMHAFVRNEGDAWSYTLENVHRFFERLLLSNRQETPQPIDFSCASLVAAAAEPLPQRARELCGAYLDSAALLGRRTAEMHVALSSGVEPDFAPEPLSEQYQQSIYEEFCKSVRRTLHKLENKQRDLSEHIQRTAKTLLAAEISLVDRFRSIVGRKLSGTRIRCHGDYHLGQVLYTGKDFVIIDFEGEPARRISERRIKLSPLRDVAGMIRSFDYAAQTVLINHVSGIVKHQELPRYQDWARFWSHWISIQFLSAYLTTVRQIELLPKSDAEVANLLDVFLLEKAVYELSYELNNRPTWVEVPLSGILRLIHVDE
jgi:maltose alpha-D-glucosyltransferase/alpha-amylase